MRRVRLQPERAVIFRLTWVLVPSFLAVCASLALARDPVPSEPSIVEVRQGLAARRFDVRALEQHYANRIRTLDRAGPRLNSVIEVNPDAAKLAAALDAGGDRGQPLFGVPVLLKDNIDTSDGMHTTAGSL